MSIDIDFEKESGLVPAIVQDAHRGDVLMLGFMNRAALERTLRTGFVTFFSRSRQKLWTKGETSGNRLRMARLRTDCDRDALLIEAEVEGTGAVCHEGYRSCFFREWKPEAAQASAESEAAVDCVEEGCFEEVGERVFDPADVYKQPPR